MSYRGISGGPLHVIFDGIFSRFGVMFFDEPATAFADLAQSLRPGGRFVAVAWAALDANPWMFLPNMFAAGPLQTELSPPGPGEPGPFSLADADQTRSLLGSAGFQAVEVDTGTASGPPTRPRPPMPSAGSSPSARISASVA